MTSLFSTITFIVLMPKFKKFANNHFDSDFCKIKYHFVEDYLFVLLAFPLTGLLYLRNSLDRGSHSPQCTFALKYKNSISVNSKNSIFTTCKLFFMSIFWCSCNLIFPIPMNPFSKKNRLISNELFLSYLRVIFRLSKWFTQNFQDHFSISPFKNYGPLA